MARCVPARACAGLSVGRIVCVCAHSPRPSLTHFSLRRSQTLDVLVLGARLEDGEDSSSGGAATSLASASPPQVLGRVRLPVPLLGSGPTRNDHPLVTTLADKARANGAADGASSSTTVEMPSDASSAGTEADETPTGGRLAFRCRVSELRTWKLQLERVRVHLEPEALESAGNDAVPSRSYLFSLSYIFTSGSTDTASKEQEWRSPTSLLKLAAPGTPIDIEWAAHSPPPRVPPPSRDHSGGPSSCSSPAQLMFSSSPAQLSRGASLGGESAAPEQG